MYDPIFDAEDVAVLVALKCRVISETQAGEVRTGWLSRSLSVADAMHQAYADAPARGHTLYYMPHCEQFLYDGVLDACARVGALHRVALLGNSFGEYAEREDLRPADQRRREASTLLQLQPLITGTRCLHAPLAPCLSEA